MNYFEVFGPPKEEPFYFVSHSSMNCEVGGWPTTFQKIIEYTQYTIMKIIPRLLLCGITPLLLGNYLTRDGQIIAVPILLAIVFHFFQPSVNTLYLIHKEEDYDKTYYKLLSYSKDLDEGFIVYKKSFAIKNISKLGLMRLAASLIKHIDLDDYERIYSARSIKEYNKQHQKRNSKIT